MKTLVGVQRCADYDPDRVEDALNALIERAGGWPETVGPGTKVLVKPNLLLPTPPERAVTTHPAVLRAVLKSLQQTGAEVSVGEQPGLLHLPQIQQCFDKTGTKQVCEELGVPWAVFSERGYRQVEVPDGRQADTLHIAKDILAADFVVSLAKAKTHLQSMFTGAVKNMFGTIPGKDRKRLHILAKYELFSESLVDILAASKPSFAVMDGVVGMAGKGPSEGEITPMGFLVAGADAVAVDRVTSTLMGYRKLNIHHLKHAQERGLGIHDLEQIQINGADLKRDALKLKPPPTLYKSMPSFFYRLGYSLISVQPRIDPELCRECRICAESCPAECISFDNGPHIDYSRCIECFCCHELCPHGAVKEKLGPLRKVERIFRRGS